MGDHKKYTGNDDKIIFLERSETTILPLFLFS